LKSKLQINFFFTKTKPYYSYSKETSKPDRKSIKVSPETAKKSKAKPSPKTPKESAKKANLFAAKKESPENKPSNEQSKAKEEENVKDDGKTIKVQSAGAGQAGADYNPRKKHYHPVDDAFWKRGEK
jgi:thiol:disulfide interchange protein